MEGTTVLTLTNDLTGDQCFITNELTENTIIARLYCHPAGGSLTLMRTAELHINLQDRAGTLFDAFAQQVYQLMQQPLAGSV